MKVTGRLHAPSTLTQEKQSTVPIVRVGHGTVLDGCRNLKNRKKFLVLCRDSTTIPWPSNQLRGHHIASIFRVKLSLSYVSLTPKMAATLFSETSIQLKNLRRLES
jgi:hypothetical protein